jgi:hypothetical protein
MFSVLWRVFCVSYLRVDEFVHALLLCVSFHVFEPGGVAYRDVVRMVRESRMAF